MFVSCLFVKEFFQMMRRYASPYGKHLGGAVVLNVLSAVFNVFSFAVVIPLLNILFRIDASSYSFMAWNTPGYSFKDLLVNNLYWKVSELSASWGAVSVLLALSAAMIVMTILKTSCYFGAKAVMVPIRTGIARDIRMDLYDKFLSLPIGYFTRERRGELIARMSGDVTEVENSVTASIEMLIKDPILIIVYFGILIFTSPGMMLFTVLFVPAFVWVMGAVGKKLKRQSLEVQSLWSDTMSQVDETLGGLRAIKAFNAGKRMSERFSDITLRMKKWATKVGIRQALAHPVSELLGTIMIMVVLSFGGIMIIRGGGAKGMDAPQFIFFMIILYSVIEPIKELSKAAYGIPKGLASMERIDAVLNTPNPIVESQNPVRITTMEKGISFSGVSFSHDGSTLVLKDIDLFIPKGWTVALVGESGAGKSTLADLIPRFHDVTEGRITIDDIPIKDLSIKDLRGLTGIVDQQPVLFNDTIFNNIAFGMEGATRDAVEQAARTANAHGFIMEKPDGYDTVVGDRGAMLSGGERQRICIARAILRNPPLLILDEATASLDSASEKAVREALERLMVSRTTVAIAHRLSTIRNSDMIVVLHDGRIVEKGRHEELLAIGGYYNKLYEMQAL